MINDDTYQTELLLPLNNFEYVECSKQHQAQGKAQKNLSLSYLLASAECLPEHLSVSLVLCCKSLHNLSLTE